MVVCNTLDPPVPDMLVYVDPDRLAALGGDGGDGGRPWTIRRGELVARDLLQPPDWTLYVATVRDGHARVIAYLERVAVDREELGDATTCDVDITAILDRLGCLGGGDGFATWAARPRVLTKADADLLRYRLGLPLDMSPGTPVPPAPPAAPPAPTIAFSRDPTAAALLAAVHDDLASDANRMVLADRLLELGDPRGELIALQLARARSGAPATPRERELIAQYGAAWLQPLTPCLASYELRRGFLAAAVTHDRLKLPPGGHAHPLWATVEELETRSPTLLLSPALRSLRRVAVDSELLVTLAQQRRPLAIETIVGGTIVRGGERGDVRGGFVQGGVALPQQNLRLFEGTRVLENVRAMSLDIGLPGQDVQARRFLETRLGGRLSHIELFQLELAAVSPYVWLEIYHRKRPLSLGLRGFVDGWLVAIVRQRGSIVVQLGSPSTDRPPDLWPIANTIDRFGHGVGPLKIEQVGEEGAEIDLNPAVAPFRRMFPAVELVRAHRWRSP
jgi:uncharacterized protein (TIGR02996 family)